jgi:hypothetical protein
MDDKYGGKWPETSNYGKYPKEEFENTFNASYSYAISTINDFYYTEEQRERSLESRRLSKNVGICILHDIIKKKNEKIKKKDLLEEINKKYKKYSIKPISIATLKRYLSELKNMDEDDLKVLHEDLEHIKNERKKELYEALESSEENSRKVKSCKKRLKQVNIK